MSQGNVETNTNSSTIGIPSFVIISILTIFAIGPQYFINLSYTMNQQIIQNGLHFNSQFSLYPATLSNLAFALGVLLGPMIARNAGIRKHYLTCIFLFLCASILNVFAPNIVVLILGRVVQSLSAGMIFLTMLPISLRSFPGNIRNFFLFMIITGLFGSTAMGACFGSLSLNIDAWRWLFILNIITSIICLIVGYFTFPKHKEHQKQPIDKMGIYLLTLIMFSLATPLCNLMDKGFSSFYVWPYLIVAGLLILIFIYVDLQKEVPLVPFATLKAAKPISGTIMAVASHILLVLSIAGINGFLRNDKDLPYHYLVHFYFWFFIGILITAILKTLLYSKLGAGVMGIIGSVAVIYVSLEWRTMNPDVSLTALYVQVACLGAGVSMVLVGGALGTALAGDLHKASLRSTTLHSIRNFVGAIISPVIGWYLSRQNQLHYEHIRSTLGQFSGETNMEISQLTKQFMQHGLPQSKAENMAFYELVLHSKKGAVLGAYHDLFTIMLIVSIIMILASIGKMATGKGLGLVPKKQK
ncbi:MFS transporter [Heyndrickxia ginsengihumi]|uniref:MFS transporter n=1 Tax=Heyndrickxia ginsengihumi TaxID=363870 RepID=UPI00203F9EBA|nr:MFS transporter [Heyndrickxia ginsengihumi]MCM3021805.1 MFS transporter [Heyndrickxia ginsengihumi]